MHVIPPILRTLWHIIQAADRSVYYFLSGFQGNWFLDRLASHLESDNLLKTAPAISVLWYFWFCREGDQLERRSTILTVLIGTFVGLSVTRGLANLVPFRIRPMYDPNLLHHQLSLPLPNYFVDLSSFPSDHAAFLAALGFGLIYLSRRLTAPIVAYVFAWVCMPRMYLGIHYASDVIAGAGIGIAAVWACLRTEWIRSRVARQLLAFMEAKPQIFYMAAFVITFEMGVLFLDVRDLGRALLHVASIERFGNATEEIVLVCLFVTLFALWLGKFLTNRRCDTKQPRPL